MPVATGNEYVIIEPALVAMECVYGQEKSIAGTCNFGKSGIVELLHAGMKLYMNTNVLLWLHIGRISFSEKII